ncbi:MAG TPA: alkaline phosphatase family protein [Kofleriaceae bacterium]|jgi:phospholipase C
MENHSRDQIIGSKDAPYITQLAHSYTSADGYHDAFVHPSEPNYLFMAAGENFDILDDDDPASHPIDATGHIADQLEEAGLTWKSYQEGMGDPCGLKSHGRYAAKHNPFVYFNNINGWDGTQMNPTARCLNSVVDFSNLATDIAAGTVPNYAFITPDLDDDMHDGSIGDGDQWLAKVIPQIQASAAYQNGGVIFLLWDEGGGYPAGDDPPFIVISEHAKKGFVSYEDYDQSNYLKTVEVMLGVANLPCDSERDGITSMDEMFADPIAPLPTTTPNGSGNGPVDQTSAAAAASAIL